MGPPKTSGPPDSEAQEDEGTPDKSEPKPPGPAPTDPTSARVTFHVWLVIYALVGAQMAWILRPFIGAPDLPFEWFREREANLHEPAVVRERYLAAQRE